MDSRNAFPVGSKVKLRISGEVGVVIHSWWDTEVKVTDYYVAIFGPSIPTTKPDKIPYVLRYAETSLELLPG